MTVTQLEGTIKFGETEATAVDVSSDVYSLKLIEERATNTRRPTFGNATEGERAGAYRAMFAVEFAGDLDPTTSGAHAEVTAAIRRDDALLWVEGTLRPGAVSASNPRYGGYVVVSAVGTGGDVGSDLEESHTWTITDGELTIDDGT